MNKPAQKKARRSNFYIDKDFQNNFIIKFFALVLVGSGITILALYLLTRLSTTVSIMHSRVVVMTTADFLLPLLVQTVVVVALVVGVASIAVTLFVSHKIAGPLYRFKQCFKELSAGNFTNSVRLRKEDQLQELASEFNQTITVVRGQVKEATTKVEEIKGSLDTIGEFNVEESKRRQFLELKNKVIELEKVLDFFRL